ncbi:MAG: hypothetical protein LBU65_08805 [Planctomycetaceae bacterium]|jgi:hypothetical protein|nr:hypothetical protein [Planctomycetaceae bacterium]
MILDGLSQLVEYNGYELLKQARSRWVVEATKRLNQPWRAKPKDLSRLRELMGKGHEMTLPIPELAADNPHGLSATQLRSNAIQNFDRVSRDIDLGDGVIAKPEYIAKMRQRNLSDVNTRLLRRGISGDSARYSAGKNLFDKVLLSRANNAVELEDKFRHRISTDDFFKLNPLAKTLNDDVRTLHGFTETPNLPNTYLHVRHNISDEANGWYSVMNGDIAREQITLDMPGSLQFRNALDKGRRVTKKTPEQLSVLNLQRQIRSPLTAGFFGHESAHRAAAHQQFLPKSTFLTEELINNSTLRQSLPKLRNDADRRAIKYVTDIGNINRLKTMTGELTETAARRFYESGEYALLRQALPENGGVLPAYSRAAKQMPANFTDEENVLIRILLHRADTLLLR